MIKLSFNTITPFLAALLFTAACSSSKQSTTTIDRNDIKGTWRLDKVNYEGIPAGQNLKLTLLDEGDDACLTGSTWVFPNNGNGFYTIANGGSNCIAGQRNIVWSYQGGAQPGFQFKRMPGGVKAKDVTDGYRFRVLSATESALILQSEVNYQGSPIYINYQFSKQ